MKCFKYIEQIDAFLVLPEFKKACEELGIAEWTPVVWMGRLFAMDQDFGEHWFDNWDEREAISEQAKALGIDDSELLIVVPARFTEHHPHCYKCKKDIEIVPCPGCKSNIHVRADGPCYSDIVKKAFWTDVLKSMDISEETLKLVASDTNVKMNF